MSNIIELTQHTFTVAGRRYSTTRKGVAKAKAAMALEAARVAGEYYV